MLFCKSFNIEIVLLDWNQMYIVYTYTHMFSYILYVEIEIERKRKIYVYLMCIGNIVYFTPNATLIDPTLA